MKNMMKMRKRRMKSKQRRRKKKLMKLGSGRVRKSKKNSNPRMKKISKKRKKQIGRCKRSERVSWVALVLKKKSLMSLTNCCLRSLWGRRQRPALLLNKGCRASSRMLQTKTLLPKKKTGVR